MVVWGGLNGLYQVVGELLMPVRDQMVKLLHLNRASLGHKLVHVLGTFLLVDFSWIFFRAQGFGEALQIIKALFTVKNPWVLFDGSLYTCGLDDKNFRLMILCILVLTFADFCRRKHIVIRRVIMEQDYWCRWLCYVFAVMVLLIFGKYGPLYDAASFIYFQF